MEHSCQQCGTTVEDGRPFCPQCRTPQIHVQIESPKVEAAPDLENATDELSPDTVSEAGLRTPETQQKTIPGSLDRRTAVHAALKAGALGFFIGMLIPFVAIVLAGGLAVFFYRRESGLVLPALPSSRIGSAAGVVAVAIQSFFFTIWIFVFHRQQEYIDSVTKFVHSMGADASIPDIQASIRNLFTPAGLVLTLVLALIVALVLGSIGGALATLFLRTGKTRG